VEDALRGYIGDPDVILVAKRVRDVGFLRGYIG